MIGYIIWDIIDDRKTIIRAAEIQTQGYARALKEHAERTFSELDLVLQAAVRQVEAAGGQERTDKATLEKLLRRNSSAIKQIATLAVVDSSGRVKAVSIADPYELPRVTDRPYYRFHLADRENRLFINPPFKSRVTGKWRFSLSRRINTPSGGFGGVIVASLDLKYFEDLYTSLASDRNARYSLVTISGEYLVLVPSAPNVYAEGRKTLQDFRKMVAQKPADTYHRARSNVAGEQRIVSYHRLDDYPVVAIMSFNLKRVLDDWRRTVIETSVIVSLFMLLVIVLSLKLLKQVSLLDRKVHERTAMLSLANRFLEEEVEERKKIEESLHEHQLGMEKMSVDLSLAEDRERGRIAGELHDQVCQRLILCKIRLDEIISEAGAPELLEKLLDMEKLLEQSIQDIRTLTFQMRPPVLASAGLVPALKWLGDELYRDYALEVKFDCSGCDSTLEDLRFEISNSLFQVIRELLLNVKRHSGVSMAWLTVQFIPGQLFFCIRDKGTGFNIQQETRISPRGGFGLYNIKQKIGYMGGSCQFESASGMGTSVTISLPLKPELFKEHLQ